MVPVTTSPLAEAQYSGHVEGNASAVPAHAATATLSVFGQALSGAPSGRLTLEFSWDGGTTWEPSDVTDAGFTLNEQSPAMVHVRQSSLASAPPLLRVIADFDGVALASVAAVFSVPTNLGTIDLRTTGVGRLGVGQTPVAIGVSQETGRVFVANVGFFGAPSGIAALEADGTLLQTRTGIWGRGIGVLSRPSGQPGGFVDDVYVADQVLDGTDLTTVASIPFAPAFDGDRFVEHTTGRVYLANGDDGDPRLAVVNGATHLVEADTAVGTRPLGVAVDPVTAKVFVGHGLGAPIDVLDAQTLAPIAEIPFPVSGFGAIAANPNTNRVSVSNALSGRGISVIDGSTNQLIGSLFDRFMPSPSAIAVDVARNRLYAAGGGVFIIDGATEQLIASVPSLSGERLAFHQASRRVYATDRTREAVLSFVDTFDTPLAYPDIAISGGCPSGPLLAGSEVACQWRLDNQGIGPSASVRFAAFIRNVNASYVSFTAAAAACVIDVTNRGPVGSCTLPMAAGASAVVDAVIRFPSTPGNGTISLSAIAIELDLDRTNHVLSELYTLVNTPGGSQVVVSPVDGSTTTTPAVLTFTNVTHGGNTALTTSSSGPAPPAGFQVGSPATHYELTTTATFTGSIQVCIDYTGITFAGTPALFHFENGAWVNVSTSLDTVNEIVCGSVTSLSPFAIFAQGYSATVGPPINATGTSVFKANRGVVPVKFSLSVGGVSTCALPAATIAVSRLGAGDPASVNESEFVSPSDSGSEFRIDGCQYIYNLAVRSLGSGTYAIDIVIGGSAVGRAVFALR